MMSMITDQVKFLADGRIEAWRMDGSMVDTSMEETSSPVKKEVKEEKEKVEDANAESLPTCMVSIPVKRNEKV